MLKKVGFREIIFSVNCFIAVMLALFIAFRLNFTNPWWAMIMVYLTSQPLSGTLRAKAIYRLLGTLIGGIAMLVIIPNLVDAPELTAAAVILWVALCVYASVLDRTPRAYALAVAGFTAALVDSRPCSIPVPYSTSQLRAWRRSRSAPCPPRWCIA